jgi:hypothetical protein
MWMGWGQSNVRTALVHAVDGAATCRDVGQQ